MERRGACFPAVLGVDGVVSGQEKEDVLISIVRVTEKEKNWIDFESEIANEEREEAQRR